MCVNNFLSIIVCPSIMSRLFKNFIACEYGKVRCVAFTPDGRYVASAGTDCKIRIHDNVSADLMRTMEGHTAEVWSLIIINTGWLKLLSTSLDFTARVWNINIGVEEMKLYHARAVYCAAITPCYRFGVTGTARGDFYVWSMNDGSLVQQLPGSGLPNSLSVSPDGLHVVSSCIFDQIVCVWQLADGTLQHRLEHPHWVTCVAVTSDSQHIVSGCNDGIVRLFNKNTGTLVREFPSSNNTVHALTLSIIGQKMAVCYSNNLMRIWDLTRPNNFEPLSLAVLSPNVSEGAAFNPNCKQVAVVYGPEIYLWTVCEWHDRDHHLFNRNFKALVFLLMCIKSRLDQHTQDHRVLPRLPMAVWLQVFGFMQIIF